MRYSVHDCPLCGETFRLYESSNGRFLAVHADEDGTQPRGVFRAFRDAAIHEMIRPHTGVALGACPQAWSHSLMDDGDPGDD